MKNYYPTPFDIDVSLNGGYLYTTQARLSSVVANQRLTKATLDFVTLKGKTVIDVGCGDGVFTAQLYKKGQPKKMWGIDSSKEAVDVAHKLYNRKNKNLQFFYGDIYHLSRKFSHSDLALVRGVIHHVEDPQKAIQSVANVASEILVLEPNGYNPLLKIIEQISPYHRFHKEKSYTPVKIRRWLKAAGFRIVKDEFISLVPFFFPDILTVIFKKIEPLVEGAPYLRNGLCGVYVVHAKKNIMKK